MPTSEPSHQIQVDRKRLVASLKQVGRVVPARCTNRTLQCVRLDVSGDRLTLSGTNLDCSLVVAVEAEGTMPPCIVPHSDLLRRVQNSRNESCTLRIDPDTGDLLVNGGLIEHLLQAVEVSEFPLIRSEPQGVGLRIIGQNLRDGLAVALHAAAKTSTRYAINGILLDCDAKTPRLVATDGRRLVMAELDQTDSEFKGQVILPRQASSIACKLIGRKSTDDIVVSIDEQASSGEATSPTEIFVSGPDWMLSCQAAEGQFPKYRDVVPRSQSKFIVERNQFVEALKELSVTTDGSPQGIRLDLGEGFMGLTGTGQNQSTGRVEAEFDGGGDSHIITGFNPAFLLDAAETLSGPRMVIDVGQNELERVRNSVRSHPALLYDAHSTRVIWVVMSVALGLEPSRETLGSNFEGEDDSTEVTDETATAETPATSVEESNAMGKSHRRRRVEHDWPEIGTRLDGELQGEKYAALVIAAPKLKSGRALQLITGPAMGQIFNSMSAAMVAATAKQRQELGQGKSKKGLPQSGWSFWHIPQPQRMSA